MKKLMKTFANIFFKGLVAILPLILTIWVIMWLGTTAESFFGGLLQTYLPEDYYWPGMGVVIGIALVFAIGLLMEIWLVRKLFQLAEKIIEKIPLVKTVYGGLRDLMDLITKTTQEKDLQRVVVVTLGEDTRLIGFTTVEDTGELPEALSEEQRVAVYLPMSYQLGGYTVFVPKSKISQLDWSMEYAMRYALTAGVSSSR
jgi:uncharacterized membrane protein